MKSIETSESDRETLAVSRPYVSRDLWQDPESRVRLWCCTVQFGWLRLDFDGSESDLISASSVAMSLNFDGQLMGCRSVVIAL